MGELSTDVVSGQNRSAALSQADSWKAFSLTESIQNDLANVVLKDWSDEIANQITPDLINGKNS